jgi:hypothetical protein
MNIGKVDGPRNSGEPNKPGWQKPRPQLLWGILTNTLWAKRKGPKIDKALEGDAEMTSTEAG